MQRIPSAFLISLRTYHSSEISPLQRSEIQDRVDQLIDLLRNDQLELTNYIIHSQNPFPVSLLTQKLHHMLFEAFVVTVKILNSGKLSLMQQHDLITQILCKLQNMS